MTRAPIHCVCAALALAALALALLWPAVCAGHTRSTSWSVWTIRGGEASVRVRLSSLDETALMASERLSGAIYERASHLQRRVALFSEGARCTPIEGTFIASESEPGSVRAGWSVRCLNPQGPWEARSDLLFGVVPAHAHMTSISIGEATIEGVLTATDRALKVKPGAEGPSWSLSVDYGWLGIWHILTGWDHLVFLLALVVMAGSLRTVAIAATGFTIGHSATLSLSILGLVQVDAASVEALIGLSILLVASENIWLQRPAETRTLYQPGVLAALLLAAAGITAFDRPGLAISLLGTALFVGCTGGLMVRSESPERIRGSTAALFGLLHGFGFAAALQELAPSKAGLAAALVSFNVGVEIGQLALLGLIWPALLLCRHKGVEGPVIRWVSAVSAGLGAFWFVSRAFG